jgi:predicted permease
MGNLKLALRMLGKSPFVTVVAILSLALGIGANAAIYSLFDQMLLRSLPVSDPASLVNLSAPGPKPGSQSCGQAGDCNTVFSHPMFKDLERAETGLALAAHFAFGANLAKDGLTLNGRGMMVSGSYFSVLGLRPSLGRLLGPADDEVVGEGRIAVLSHSYWTNRLGADKGVLNQIILVNGEALTIVGVAPKGFEGTTLGRSADVFLPITLRGLMFRTWPGFDSRRSYWVYLFGRRAPGVSLEQARTAINTVYSGIVNEVEAPLQTGMSDETLARFRAKQITLEPGRRGQSTLHAEVDTPLKMLFAITGVVLLIACANIANLLMARGAGRAQEMAVRGSLGASRRQLLGQLLTESWLLATLGALASVLVARWTLVFLGSFLPPQTVGVIVLAIRPEMLGFTALLAIGTGFVFGLYPALHSTRTDLVTALKGVTGQSSGARAAVRFRTSLVTAQIALSMTLLVAAGLFVKSLTNVSRVDLGLTATNLVTFGVSPSLNGYTPERSRVLFARMEEEVGSIPGVESISSSMVPLLAGDSWGNDVNVQGFERGPDIDANSRFNLLGPDYFRTLGVPLLAGREFTIADGPAADPVVVVNEAFTKKFGLDGVDAIGQWVSTGGSGRTRMMIVGVIRDAKYSEVKLPIPPVYYKPYRQDSTVGSLSFYVRTSSDPRQVMRAIPEVIKGIDPDLPVEELKTVEHQVQENVVLDRMIATLSAAFAVLATLLAAIGLYGVLAYAVTQRTREIGLRMALGADAGQVRGMVLRQVGQMAVVGGLIGLGAALLLGRVTRSLLFGLEANDPLVITGVVLLVGGVVLGAGYFPARRASRVDPMRALRYE